MTTYPLDKTRLAKTLKQAVSEGEAGRKELISRLAALSLEDLAKVPPSTLALLGPEGLARLSATRSDLTSGLVARNHSARQHPEHQMPDAKPNVKRRNFSRLGGMLSIFVLFAGPTLDEARPFAGQIMDKRWRPADASTWSQCPRLNAYVDGCVYVTGNGQTTLAKLAHYLEIPPDRLLDVNRHLTGDFHQRLAGGSTVVVWRGKLQLGGVNR